MLVGLCSARSARAGGRGRGVRGHGFGLVRRCAVREPSRRRIDCSPWPGGPNGCCSARPAWARSRCAIRSSLPTNGPRSMCWNGRTRLVACAGGGAGPLWEAESAAMNVAPGERRKRMVENIHVLRHLWTNDNAPFVGQFTNSPTSRSSRSRCSRHVRSGWRPMPSGCRKVRPTLAGRTSRSRASARSRTAG